MIKDMQFKQGEAIAASVVLLKRMYPRAVTYSDLHYHLYGATSSIESSKVGGGLCRNLVKAGYARRISDGFYCWTGKETSAK